MAERSFSREVKDLELGQGETFKGEGILAITKALLQSGVGYVGGYQGSPISHLMDVLADADDLLKSLGVHFESSASEASAAAMLAASVMYPIRGAVTWKSTAGTNVASDALSNLASGGVKGGALIILGEDYGEGSSIMQERSQAFAMKSQMWLLDPRPNLPSLVNAVEKGFELSEASNTPVMLELRVRACHVYGQFETKDNQRPMFPLKRALEEPVRDLSRIVLPPASYIHEHEKIEQRWPAAVKYIKDNKLNEYFGPQDGKVGIIVQGGLYNSLMRALQLLGLADVYGNSALPVYVLNVAYPIIDDEVLEYCQNKESVLLLEEGQPEYIEQIISAALHGHGLKTTLFGKNILPRVGEYSASVLVSGIQTFLDRTASEYLGNMPAVPTADDTLRHPEVDALKSVVPQRPPGFCVGCPERPIFAAMKLVERELGPHHIASDIGCHLFSILPPFNIGATTMGYGLAGASASAFNVDASKKPIAILGDGGFWHNGLVSSVGNAVFNKQDSVILVVDNHYAAATGGQDILSSRAQNERRSTNHPIAKAAAALGVTWIRELPRTYDVSRMRQTLKEALTTKSDGPKLIVASSECMLNRQRRERPQKAKNISEGKRVLRQRFGVDEDVCTGDHACIRLSGCPSLSVKKLDDPFRDDPVASIDESCVACGNCGEVADAAVLCPSFYRADIVVNPTRFDRMLAAIRSRFIGFLQRRRSARLKAMCS